MRFIGIDPDVNKSGLSIWCSEKNEFEYLGAVNFFDLVTILYDNKDCKIRIEDSSSLPANYHKGGNKNVREKIAYNVGRCVQISLLLQEFCKRHKLNYEAVTPKNHKINSSQFKLMTGLTVKNQDIIDSAMLVYRL